MERLLGRLSIRWSVVAISLIGVAVVIAVGATVTLAAAQLKSAGEIARSGRDDKALADDVRIALGDAIGQTATFLRTRDERLPPVVRAKFQAADAAVTKLAVISGAGGPWADNVAILAAGVRSMSNLFDHLAALQQEIGFTPNLGLRANMMRAEEALHNLIDDWAAIGRPIVGTSRLQEKFLAMRLAGDEYQLNGEESALETFRNAGAALQDAVTEKDVAAEDLAAFRTTLLDYNDAFENLISAIDQARGKIDNLEAWAAAIVPRYDDLEKGFGEKARAGDDRFSDILTHNLRAMLWMMAAATVLAGGCSIIFGRAVAKPITRMTGAMNDIAAGDLTAAIPCQDQSNELGKMARALAVFKDNATAIRRANEELQHQLTLLATIMDNAAEAVFLCGTEDRLTFMNRAAERMFGWRQDELLGQVLHDALHHHYPEGRPYPISECPFSRVFTTLETQTNREDKWIRRDGTFIDVSVSNAPIIEGGHAVGAVLVMHDISERRRTEDQVRQLQKMEAIGKLTGGVAHDFNNLLAIVGGNLELIQERLADNPDLCGLAQKALRAVERGATLTRSLLAFSRQQPLSPRVIDIKKLVQDMADLVRRTVPENIEIEVVAGAGLWKCEADPGELQNALLNLVANARDAMPEGGRLTIETGNARVDDDYAAGRAEVTPGQYVMLAVSDTGKGMPPEVVARAFDPFFTTKGFGKGSGLGLSMVYGFAKQSKGHVKIYSEVGHGTTVRIYLPRSTAASEELAPTRLAEHVHPMGETILVVEDDADVRSLTCNLLQSLGYEVFEAAGSQQALQVLQDTPHIALLLVDVVLPGGMNGQKLGEEVLRLRPELKILYMSGYTENAILHHGRLDAGVHLLQKPFTKRELALKIRVLLNGKNS